MTTKRATKTQIDRIAREASPEGRYNVAAQGTTKIVFGHARDRMKMGTVGTSRTKLTRNGRYRVTVWGKTPETRMQRIIDALTANGYIVENIDSSLMDFEVHNGNILPLEGILRYEGTY